MCADDWDDSALSRNEKCWFSITMSIAPCSLKVFLFTNLIYSTLSTEEICEPSVFINGSKKQTNTLINYSEKCSAGKKQKSLTSFFGKSKSKSQKISKPVRNSTLHPTSASLSHPSMSEVSHAVAWSAWRICGKLFKDSKIILREQFLHVCNLIPEFLMLNSTGNPRS